MHLRVEVTQLDVSLALHGRTDLLDVEKEFKAIRDTSFVLVQGAGPNPTNIRIDLRRKEYGARQKHQHGKKAIRHTR
ncbi:hypothetical protein [Lewinella sp. IMCC34191]|uniref:hypothetical protein n=1 Tax=Lewinella sp. IMCC34191 TaxID=2259172 RepID=UPI000E22E251|nr:hypothetical protein [Lewinella sp. IMCC34191]